MRKVFVLAAAALLAPSVALADGEMASQPYFGGVFAGRTSMNMPDHANSAVQFNFGGGLTSPTIGGANVDGWTYGAGIGKNLDSGWRVLATFRYTDAEGAAAKTFTIANGTPFSRGPLSGGTPALFTDVFSSTFGGVGTASQHLDTDVQEWSASASAGRALFGPVRGDLVFIYTSTDTDYDDVINVAPFSEVYTTRTNFSESAAELAARLSVDFALMNGISVGVGGSAGYEYRHANMTANQRYFAGSPTSSVLDTQDGEYGFVGRADANLSVAVTDRISLALVGNYISDSVVPVYSAVDAPNYTTHTPATLHFETQSSTTYGLRVLTRW